MIDVPGVDRLVSEEVDIDDVGEFCCSNPTDVMETWICQP